MQSLSPKQNHLHEAIRLGLGGAKSNFLPGTVLWLIGLTLVTLYYQSGAVHSFFNQIGDVKTRFSPWFGMLSTAIFGSLIPWLAQRLLLSPERRQPAHHVPLLFLFWGVHGWQLSWLYKIQSFLFGESINAKSVFYKTLVDEFIWVPFFAVPQIVLFYLFIEKKCSVKLTKKALQQTSYLSRSIPLMFANWVVWIPAVALVYLFPEALQLPLQNIILALWCLIVMFFAKNA